MTVLQASLPPKTKVHIELDRLSAAWAIAEEKLAAFHCPFPVGVDVPSAGDDGPIPLVFIKVGKGDRRASRICIVMEDGPRPVTDCCVADRLAVIAGFPILEEAVRRRAESAAEEIAKSVEEFKQILAGTES